MISMELILQVEFLLFALVATGLGKEGTKGSVGTAFGEESIRILVNGMSWEITENFNAE